MASPPFKPISRINLHSEVMQQIAAAIQSGQWKPGSPSKARRAMRQHIDHVWKKRPHLFPGAKSPNKI